MYTAEKTPQAQPQDSLKFAARYLDGDSNIKIEAINHQTQRCKFSYIKLLLDWPYA